MKSHRTTVPGLLAAAALALLTTACGGGQESGSAAQQPAADDAAGAAPAAVSPSGSGPDPAQAQERLLANANMITPDAARIVSYRETGVRYEGPQEMQSAIVSYEAELEFTADTYFHVDHKAGDRAQVYGEIEYLNEGGTWRIMTMGIHPR